MIDPVLTATENRVRTITFNRPDRRNALTQKMYAAIAAAIESAAADGVRAIVLTGAGDAFTAGNDIGDFASGADGEKPPVVRFLEAIATTETPLIAAVNGPAVGVGLTMLLHCDLAFAAVTARFKAPFAHLGVVPEAASSVLLPQRAGVAWANEVFLAGRTLTADEALSIGLVTRIYPAVELLPAALAVATEIAALAPNAVRLTKKLVRRDRAEILAVMKEEGAHFASQLASPEFAEAAAAFLQKRKPNFG